MSSSMKSASVYLRRGVYYIHPLAGSGGGDPALFMEPVLKLEESAGAAALGQSVRQALRSSHHNAPWPTDWTHVTDPLFAAAGVKSLSTFTKGSRYVRVDITAETVTVLPTTSREHRNAFSPMPDRIIRLSADEPLELGRAVQQAIAASE